jgi:protein TonB
MTSPSHRFSGQGAEGSVLDASIDWRWPLESFDFPIASPRPLALEADEIRSQADRIGDRRARDWLRPLGILVAFTVHAGFALLLDWQPLRPISPVEAIDVTFVSEDAVAGDRVATAESRGENSVDPKPSAAPDPGPASLAAAARPLSASSPAIDESSPSTAPTAQPTASPPPPDPAPAVEEPAPASAGTAEPAALVQPPSLVPSPDVEPPPPADSQSVSPAAEAPPPAPAQSQLVADEPAPAIAQSPQRDDQAPPPLPVSPPASAEPPPAIGQTPVVATRDTPLAPDPSQWVADEPPPTMAQTPRPEDEAPVSPDAGESAPASAQTPQRDDQAPPPPPVSPPASAAPRPASLPTPQPVAQRPPAQLPVGKVEPKARATSRPSPAPARPKLSIRSVRTNETAVEAVAASADRPRADSQPQTSANQNAASQGVEAAAASRASYGAIISAEIARHKIYPAEARAAGASGTIGVAFTVGAEGRIVTHTITRSSGNPVLDGAIDPMMAAVQAPPPPGGVFRGSVSVRFDLR